MPLSGRSTSRGQPTRDLLNEGGRGRSCGFRKVESPPPTPRGGVLGLTEGPGLGVGRAVERLQSRRHRREHRNPCESGTGPTGCEKETWMDTEKPG